MPSYDELIARQNSRKIYATELTLSRDNSGIETTTLRFCRSDSQIDPDKCTVYYEPRISSIPFYKQRMQEVLGGKSQRSYGSLVLKNGDGGLDDYLTGWTWDGGAISLKLGFPELDVADFEPVFTGRMKRPKFQDGKITVPLTDYQIDFFNAVYTDAGSTDTVANHVDAMLTSVGGISKNSALWSAFGTANNFNAYLEADGEKVSTLLDRLLAPLCCWYGFNRAGEFIIGTFEAPDASTPDLTLGLDDGFDLEILDFSGDIQEQYWSIDLEYISATSPVTYSTVSRSDSNILSLNPNAQADSSPRRTLLTSSTDAETVRDRWWDHKSVRRNLVTAPVKMQPAQMRPHMQVQLTRARYNVGGNRRGIGFQEDYDNNRVSLELYA